jgi:tRNA (cytidine56-2'-O)-methyltransferase
MYLHPPDPELAHRISSVVDGWGGRFEVVGAPAWKPVVRAAPGPVVHLTMYGRPVEDVLPRLAGADELLVVVGGAKVPSELYQLADVNVAVGHQPHSEVAALAVLLARLLGVPGPGRWEGGRLAVVPRARGKRVAVHRGGT